LAPNPQSRQEHTSALRRRLPAGPLLREARVPRLLSGAQRSRTAEQRLWTGGAGLPAPRTRRTQALASRARCRRACWSWAAGRRCRACSRCWPAPRCTSRRAASCACTWCRAFRSIHTSVWPVGALPRLDRTGFMTTVWCIPQSGLLVCTLHPANQGATDQPAVFHCLAERAPPEALFSFVGRLVHRAPCKPV